MSGPGMPWLGLCGCYGTWLQMRARFECPRVLQIAVCTMCNLSTSKLQTECHIHAEIWPITGIWPIQIVGAFDVMHHATTAVLWLQCAAAFILCCVRVWANVMPCGHQNSNLSLPQGCNEPLVATGWAFDDTQGPGPGWELEFWCPWLLRIVACMWWNISTWSRQTKSYKLWHN